MKSLLGGDARKKLLDGVCAVSRVVSPTLGPKGRYVVLGGEKPVFTNDGATIAQHVNLDDGLESIGAQLVKTVALDVARKVGDGTTTATLLTKELFERSLDDTRHATVIVRELAAESYAVIKNLESLARPVTPEELQTIGSRACKDKTMGTSIASLIHSVGSDSYVFVDQGPVDSSEVVEGSVFPARYLLDPAEIEIPESRSEMPILCLDYQLTDMNSLMSVTEDLIEQGKRSMVIVATGMDGDVQRLMVTNHTNSAFTSYVYMVESPKDIALSLRVPLLKPLEPILLDDVAYAETLLSPDRIVLIGCDTGRAIASVNAEQLPDDVRQRRVAQLSGHIGFLKVSGNSTTEIEDKKIRADDGIRACQAAVRGGVVAGGGEAFLEASKDCSTIMRKSLQSIQETIDTNAGEHVSTEGVFDPLLVLTTALAHATTAACQLILSEGIIV